MPAPSSEAAHDALIEAIAHELLAHRDASRLVLIGGPSSAGKTTFAKRLAWHLQQLGAETLAISTDDYFVGDALNPRDGNGNLDYEHIGAINLELLNDNLADLLAGRAALMPRFDFHVHAPAPERHEARLPDGAFAIIEGLHSLNPDLTPAIPASAKHLILADTVTDPYATGGGARRDAVCAGAQRLIRRIIRDAQHRGRSAADTILIWPSVRAGEERWIRPFVQRAAEIFDTSLPGEPNILRPFAEPALKAIAPSSPAFETARGLLELLAAFPPVGDDDVPPYSILREYIGGSSIQY